MNIAVKIALAAALSATSLGGYAYAQTTGSVTPMADDMVTIVNVGEETNAATDTSSIPATYRNPSPETITKAQAEIQNDPGLMATLQAKNVILENVIGIQTAANGGKIVYLK
ncbi:MAG TPA: hypothetical protein VL202_03240 [Pararhizobium sp.]|uniref:hypothetical protein n=1 Tax=Pararhizobium sp. TaxID=1977563 RepID=UPI002C961F5B|nr:hypothetical protein [Pararhizobium sp.]HTO30186.1 hypothetical protein [Pararhizobium sp.]